MLCVAYETLARRGELDFHPDGTGEALIRRAKTDSEGRGRVAYLSRDCARAASSSRKPTFPGRGTPPAVRVVLALLG